MPAISYSISDRALINDLALGYVGHNLALLAVPVALAAVALAWPALVGLLPGGRSRSGPRAAINPACGSQAINVWIIQIVVAIGPPIGALIFEIYLKTDWGISLFFLTPLALIAIPSLRMPAGRVVSHRCRSTW